MTNPFVFAAVVVVGMAILVPVLAALAGAVAGLVVVLIFGG